jgi:hypothetical protein
MLSTTVVAIAATVPAGAEIVVLDESSDGSTDAIAEPWPEVQVRRRCHTSVSPAPQAEPSAGRQRIGGDRAYQAVEVVAASVALRPSR